MVLPGNQRESSTQRQDHQSLFNASEAMPEKPEVGNSSGSGSSAVGAVDSTGGPSPALALPKLSAADEPTEPLALPEHIGDASVNAKTVISQRPVAAPEEFYQSMPLAELAAMLEGRQLDHFAVEQMIGGGGMGAVFRGRDTRLDRIVAIKVIPASKRDPETLRRFRLEAQAAARLDHPNIARVYYVGEAERWNYIVFEFIEGVNVRDLVEMEGPLTVDDAVYYTRQVAEALEHARSREVVHRDIKPSNILVTAAGLAKVVDMGLARDTSMDKSRGDETASGVTLGTFDYISPEQARNPRDADTRSDLYSLGCTLFFMLTGSPPFPDGTALQKLLNHGSQPPPDPRAWRDDISDQLFEILLTLMAKRPAMRYQKPSELINDLALLAEAEDLPRSQSPGTYLFSPTVAQRSLLEANLPWMVALAFLLGSTLWLQSAESLSGEGPLPELGLSNTSASQRNVPGSTSRDLPDAVAEPELPSVVVPVPDSSASITEPSIDSASSRGVPEIDVVSSRSATVLSQGELIVVAAEQPLDIAPMQWERSLADALQRLSSEPTVKEIEVRGRVVLDRSVQLSGSTWVLRGPRNGTSIVEVVTGAIASYQDGQAAVLIQGGSLTLSNLEMVIREPTELAGENAGVFMLQGELSSVTLQRCLVTIGSSAAAPKLPNGDSTLFSLVVAGATGASKKPGIDDVEPALGLSAGLPAVSRESSQPIVGGTGNETLGPGGVNGFRSSGLGAIGSGESMILPSVPAERFSSASPVNGGVLNGARGLASPPRPKASARYQVVVAESTLRGYGCLVRFDDRQQNGRLEISVRDSLIGLSRGALSAVALNGTSNPSFVRMQCSRSSFLSRDGFAMLEYVGSGSPQLGLNRSSQSCVYWSQPGAYHLTLRGARRQSLLGNFVLLDLQGQGNAYDRNIADICQSYLGGQETATFGFDEAGMNGWFAERGNEYEVPWRTALIPPIRYSELTIGAIEVADGLFQPGVFRALQSGGSQPIP